MRATCDSKIHHVTAQGFYWQLPWRFNHIRHAPNNIMSHQQICCGNMLAIDSCVTSLATPYKALHPNRIALVGSPDTLMSPGENIWYCTVCGLPKQYVHYSAASIQTVCWLQHAPVGSSVKQLTDTLERRVRVTHLAREKVSAKRIPIVFWAVPDYKSVVVRYTYKRLKVLVFGIEKSFWVVSGFRVSMWEYPWLQARSHGQLCMTAHGLIL